MVLRNPVSDKKQSRAVRLQQEAANCLAIALTTREPDFAAALIDEALKLARRAQQIIGADLAA
ncbi:MAG TPA: hypothetical protein VM900_07500 [Sphingomonas sp.]|nr:hypothetical protein [Sphingomonas sp.]